MPKKDIIPKDELLKTLSEYIEDVEYKMNRTKVPSKKRQWKNSLRFWESMQHHIKNS